MHRVFLILLSLLTLSARADDWPQWRGAQRDGIWREKGIVEAFPAGGVKVVWRVPIGAGWASPTIMNGKVFLADSELNKPKARERVHCFDAASGKELWVYAYDVNYPDWAFSPDQDAGPTATPAVVDGKVYAVGASGEVACLAAATGAVVWRRELGKEYEVPAMQSRASPLIEGDLLILNVGAKPGACVMALDRHTGREVWTALSESVSNSSPIMIEAGGQRQLIVWTGESVTSLNPADGAVWWREALSTSNNDDNATPVWEGDRLLISGLMFKLAADKPAATVVWPESRGVSKRVLSNTSSPVLLGDVVYSATSHGDLVCLDAATGKELWKSDKVTDRGTGPSIHITPNGSLFFLYTNLGDLAFARLSKTGYDELTGGHYIAVPTVAESARAAGLSTVIAGTKGVALLHDRSETRPETPHSVTLFAGKTYPTSALTPLTTALGEFPVWKPDFANPKPNEGQNSWTTHALIDHLWKDEVPRYTVLWLSDPDFVQHISHPGHPGALASIHGSDANLGLALAALEKRGLLDKTDVFVVSDHGFSTIERTADAGKYFNDNGVHVVRSYSAPPKPGDVFMVGIGASMLLYVHDHDKEIEAKLVTLLQQGDFACAIFSRSALPGAFPLSESRLNSPESPDVIFSFRWNDAKNEHGAPGFIVAEGKPGLGTHGTLSRFDVHNTLVGAGPDIRAGYRNENPTGNIDVAPTILHLLGLDAQSAKCDGRIITEALAGTEPPTEKPVTQRREATDGKAWKQYLQTTTFAGKLYFDEGNVVLP